MKILNQLNSKSVSWQCDRKCSICVFTSICWPSGTNDFIPLYLLSCVFLFLVFFDLLKGSHQSFGCRAVAQPLGCCCSNGCCSLLEPACSPCSSSCTSSAPSPIARPTSQPRHPETCSWAHPYHPWANPLLPLLTHPPLTSASQEQPLQKHTVKIQTWSKNCNW